MQIERLETSANQDRWIFNERARGINLFLGACARAYIEANDCQEAEHLIVSCDRIKRWTVTPKPPLSYYIRSLAKNNRGCDGLESLNTRVATSSFVFPARSRSFIRKLFRMPVDALLGAV